MPQMSAPELASAVRFEARQHIPIPLSEVVLDWSIVEGGANKNSSVKILLVAVPYEIVTQYQEIAKLSQLHALSLEAEVFGILRSLGANTKGTIGLIDIGAQSTTFNIVDNGKLKATHSSDIAGNELTKILSKSLNIKYNEAEELKKKYGISTPEMPAAKVLMPLVDLLVNEIKKVADDFFQQEGKNMERIILAGGSALLPGLDTYLSHWFEKPVEIGNPFGGIAYPAQLQEILQEIGPSYAIAVGMALRGFE